MWCTMKDLYKTEVCVFHVTPCISVKVKEASTEISNILQQ